MFYLAQLSLMLLTLSRFGESVSGRVGSSLSMSTINNRACFGAGHKILYSNISYVNLFLVAWFFTIGCYWGTEKFFKIDFGKKLFPGSVVPTSESGVGFMGPA